MSLIVLNLKVTSNLDPNIPLDVMKNLIIIRAGYSFINIYIFSTASTGFRFKWKLGLFLWNGHLPRRWCNNWWNPRSPPHGSGSVPPEDALWSLACQWYCLMPSACQWYCWMPLWRVITAETELWMADSTEVVEPQIHHAEVTTGTYYHES